MDRAPPLISTVDVFIMAVNFVLGTGVLGIPYAMAHAGLLAGTASLVMVAMLSFLTCSWILEVSDRANALQNELKRTPLLHPVQRVSSPVSSFCLSASPLAEPLLPSELAFVVDANTEALKALDEHRTSYRMWRQGSPFENPEKQVMPVLMYRQREHRPLLPLQLLMPQRLTYTPPRTEIGEQASAAVASHVLQGVPYEFRVACVSAGSSNEGIRLRVAYQWPPHTTVRLHALF